MNEDFHREGGWLTKRCTCSEPATATCGTCGRPWCFRCNPTPAARCPFEYDHKDDEGRYAVIVADRKSGEPYRLAGEFGHYGAYAAAERVRASTGHAAFTMCRCE